MTQTSASNLQIWKSTNPDAYFIGFEDLRYNTPFDGIVLVEPLAEGGAKLTHVGGHPHAYRHQLKGPTGELLADPFDKGFYMGPFMALIAVMVAIAVWANFKRMAKRFCCWNI